MSEIKNPLMNLEGVEMTGKADDYLIAGHNSLADIIRFCIEQTDVDEIRSLVDIEYSTKIRELESEINRLNQVMADAKAFWMSR